MSSIAARVMAPGRSSTARPSPSKPITVDFDPERAGPAVEDQIDRAAQIARDMGRRGRADATRSDWRSARRWEAAATRQQRARHRMVRRRAPRPCRALRVPAATGAVLSRRGSTSVSAPGQNASASFSATGLKMTCASASARPPTCTISGLNRGRSLAAKIRATAALVERVGAEPVDRLGRERDQPSLAQQPRRFGDAALGGGLDARRALRRNRLHQRTVALYGFAVATRSTVTFTA